jgi:hypothetical protein
MMSETFTASLLLGPQATMRSPGPGRIDPDQTPARVIGFANEI